MLMYTGYPEHFFSFRKNHFSTKDQLLSTAKKEKQSQSPGQLALPCHQEQTGMGFSSDCQQVETFSKSPGECSMKEVKCCTPCVSFAFNEYTTHSQSRQLHMHGCESDPQLASSLLPCKMKKNYHKSPEQSPSNQTMNHQ